jgi:glucosamine 6-phosphate synthetase-like amidotransferase/phosphosugar isomerase protein
VPLALTRAAAGGLAEACAGIFLTRDEGPEDSVAAAVCQQAALSSIALTTARVVKGSGAGVEVFEDELTRLPGQVEWCFTQLSDAVRSLAHELRAMDRFWLVGGGLYHPVAVRGVRCFSGLGGVHAQGIEVSEFCAGPLSHLGRGDVAVFVSGSRSRIKRQVHRAAAQVRVAGARLISITDSNDRDLIDRSDIAILVPQLSEVGGSALALALLGLLGAESARNPERRRAGKLSPDGADESGHGPKA